MKDLTFFCKIKKESKAQFAKKMIPFKILPLLLVLALKYSNEKLAMRNEQRTS
jgi:hypothetical protein